MNREAYEPLEMEVIAFEDEDIITASDGNGNREAITLLPGTGE